MDDLKAALAAVSGDAAFAEDFFARYIQGREVVDYARLLARAGFVLRPRRCGPRLGGSCCDRRTRRPAPAWSPTSLFGTPAYQAGLDRDDIIVSVGGSRVATPPTSSARSRRASLATPCRWSIDRRGERITAVAQARRGPAASSSCPPKKQARRSPTRSAVSATLARVGRAVPSAWSQRPHASCTRFSQAPRSTQKTARPARASSPDRARA